MKIFITLICALACLQPKAQDQFFKTSAEAKELSKRVTRLFKENKIQNAISELRPYWPLPTNEIDVLEEKTIKYLNILEQRFGKSEGMLKVNEEAIKDIGIRETYLVTYKNTAIRLIFTFYKNSSGWIINALKWDDEFSPEFKAVPQLQ